MHEPRIYVISSVFHRFISHMSEFVFDVFGIIEIKRNRFSRLVMHVSGIVEERRNVVRWRYTPAGPRNQRRGSQVMIFLQIWIFFENLYLRQTIYHYQCLGQVYAYAYAYCSKSGDHGDSHSCFNPSHVPQAFCVFRPSTLTAVSIDRQCVPQVLFQV